MAAGARPSLRRELVDEVDRWKQKHCHSSLVWLSFLGVFLWCSIFSKFSLWVWITCICYWFGFGSNCLSLRFRFGFWSTLNWGFLARVLLIPLQYNFKLQSQQNLTELHLKNSLDTNLLSCKWWTFAFWTSRPLLSSLAPTVDVRTSIYIKQIL